MLKRITQITLPVCLLLMATAAAIPSPQESQEKKGPQVKDRQEYDLIQKAIGETDPAAKIQVLDQWKEKYLETDYEVERLRMYMASYQQTQQPAKAIETAKELLEKVPGDFSASYTITLLTPFLGDTSPAVLGDGETAAKGLLAGAIEKQFASKPENISQADWDSAKKGATVSAYQTLGWIAMQRKENVAAEEQFKQVLQLNPNAGQVSYWLGNVVLAQGDPTKNETALFSFARASVYEGEGALPPESRQQVDAYLTKVYTKYAGTEEGLDELKAMARNQALPPADLKIESAEVRSFNAEQAARKANPQLYMFIDLKNKLTGTAGEQTWSELRGKLTPEFRLYVVSANPPERPQTINLSSRQGGPVEVVLNLEVRRRTGLGSGQLVRFEGVASDLTRQPFRLTLVDGQLL